MTQLATQQLDFNDLVFPVIVESRFGELIIQKEDLVFMPEGIYGFEEYANYGLIPLPQQEKKAFYILQCLDEVGLIFLLSPLKQGGEYLIPVEALKEAMDTLKLPLEQCAFYAITTVRSTPDGLELSLNLKAPIIHDKKENKVWQNILEKSDFPIEHKLKLEG